MGVSAAAHAQQDNSFPGTAYRCEDVVSSADITDFWFIAARGLRYTNCGHVGRRYYYMCIETQKIASTSL